MLPGNVPIRGANGSLGSLPARWILRQSQDGLMVNPGQERLTGGEFSSGQLYWRVMAIALETVVKQLEDSGIVAPGKLENFVPPKAHPTSVEALVAELVKENHLTKFQAAQVAGGRAKSLILGGYTILDKI